MALTANCDGIASKCKFFQPIGLCTEFDNVVYVCDTQTSYIKILTTLNNTARFLQAVDALYSAFSVHDKHDEYSLCNLPLMTACVFWRRMCHPSRTWSTPYHGLLMALKEVLLRRLWTLQNWSNGGWSVSSRTSTNFPSITQTC